MTQLTIDNVPDELAKALREKAALEGKTVNELAVEVLANATGVRGQAPTPPQRDFSGIIGTWVEDPVFDEIRQEMERIDPDLWK